MNPSRAFRHSLPVPFLLLPALLSLAVAAPKPPVAERFEEVSHVVDVEVPVNVVGRDGKPVRGLTAADFSVLDEGAAQKISHFEVVDLAALSAPSASARPGVPLDPPPAGRRHFLLLFDLSFSSPTAVLKARLAAREFLLHSLAPSDLAAVATFSLENGPRLVVSFTPDRAQLARGIDTLGFRQPVDQEQPKGDPLHFVIAPPASATASLDVPPELMSERSAARNAVDVALLESLTLIQKTAEKDQRSFEQSQITGYARALGEMAKALNSVEGRKQVLYFSEGFDSKLLLGRSDLADQESITDNQNIAAGRSWLVDSDARYGNTGLQTGINHMLEEFRRANCVIQAVDIGGLRADGNASDLTRAGGQEGLFYLANETGGELLKDTNDLGGQLSRVLEHTSVTYLLTFSRSDLPENGAYHRLKVKAKLPAGARLTHRAGYYAPRPFAGLDPLEKTLLAADGIAGAAPRRDLRFNVLVAPFRSTESRGYVPVIVEVPGKGLLAGQRGDRLGLELYAYGSNARGEMKDFFSQTIGLDIKKGRQAIEDTGIKYYGHLDLPPGAYRIRVLVRNTETGRTGVQSVALSVPPYKVAQPVLLPPFFMEARQSWALVRERTAETAAEQAVVYPFTVNGEPYVPAARPALKRAEQVRVCLVAYNLGAGDLGLAGKVVGSDGKARAGGSLALVERTATGISGLDKLIATFKPVGLDVGDYVLQVAVTDPATGLKETNSVPFEVKD